VLRSRLARMLDGTPLFPTTEVRTEDSVYW